MPQGANDNGSMMSVMDMFQANFRAILDADDIDVNIYLKLSTVCQVMG